MTFFLVPIVALLLIAGAIALEFAGRNYSQRPFSRHSANKRWDDPNNKDKSDTLVPGSFTGSGLTLGHQNPYLISKDPEKQSRFLAG